MDQYNGQFHLDLTNPSLTALICKALSSEVRLKILSQLTDSPKSISDLSAALHVPMSSMTSHIHLLVQARLISVTPQPGSRGTQKRCGLIANNISISLTGMPDSPRSPSGLVMTEEMPVGNYFDYEVSAPCGIISHEKALIPFDDPGRFSSPDRVHAQLIWLTTGYLEYRFPLDAAHPFQTDIERIEFSFEICSETFSYNEFWRSDVSIWINNQEIGYIECPGDHGGRYGLLSPEWWSASNTQYGDLAKIILTKNGYTINSYTSDKYTIDSLDICNRDYVSLKIGVKKDAQFAGGFNLFGEKFGDHPQAISMRVYGRTHLPAKNE